MNVFNDHFMLHVLFAIISYHRWADDWQIVLLLANLACFFTTTLYPLILTYWFQRQQRHAAVVIERVTKISDLMAFPAAMEVFTRYTQSEL